MVTYLTPSLLKAKEVPRSKKQILPNTKSMRSRSRGFALLRGDHSRFLLSQISPNLLQIVIGLIIWFPDLQQIKIRKLQGEQLIKEAINES